MGPFQSREMVTNNKNESIIRTTTLGLLSINCLCLGSAKFKDIKQEILASPYINIKIYNDTLLVKASNYLKSNAIKQLKPSINPDHGNHNYGIDKDNNNKITISQILSLISYCDLTDFSREWSSTFRFIHFGEPLEQVKARNSRFYHCSKNLIEIVNVFGIGGVVKNLHGHCHPNGEEDGPYYCGLNRLLTFPSYVTRFCGPCSTSKAKEVAIKFADRDGLIMQVNNRSNWYLQFFDCSWLSTYKEEEERVFISGVQTIKIENITIIETAKQYKTLAVVYQRWMIYLMVFIMQTLIIHPLIGGMFYIYNNCLHL